MGSCVDEPLDALCAWRHCLAAMIKDVTVRQVRQKLFQRHVNLAWVPRWFCADCSREEVELEAVDEACLESTDVSLLEFKFGVEQDGESHLLLCCILDEGHLELS